MTLRPLLVSLPALLAVTGLSAEDAVVSVRLDVKNPGRKVPAGFAGFSREWRRFVPPDGGPAEKVHPAYLKLIEQLARFNPQGPCFRIGGNSADGMGAAPEAARWQQIAEIYRTTRMPVIININLAKENLDLDRTLIADAQKYLPAGSVLAYELGNEPDGWAGRYRAKEYTFGEYLPVFTRFGQELLPALGTKLAGPAYAHGAPVGPLGEFIASQKSLVQVLTVHSYRFDPKSQPKVERLLDDRDSAGFAQKMVEGIKLAHDSGMTIRLTEAGSAWGGGIAEFSDSYAAALWTVDVLFELAKAGMDGVHFHGGGMSNYTPIREEEDAKTKTAKITARAPYYGMMLFSEATANEARMIPTDLPAGGKLKAWATVDRAGAIRVVLINKDSAAAVDAVVALPGKAARLKRLAAPALGAAEGITYDGQTWDGSTTGEPMGMPSGETVPAEEGQVRVHLPAASAVLVVPAE